MLTFATRKLSTSALSPAWTFNPLPFVAWVLQIRPAQFPFTSFSALNKIPSGSTPIPTCWLESIVNAGLAFKEAPSGAVVNVSLAELSVSVPFSWPTAIRPPIYDVLESTGT